MRAYRYTAPSNPVITMINDVLTCSTSPIEGRDDEDNEIEDPSESEEENEDKKVNLYLVHGQSNSGKTTLIKAMKSVTERVNTPYKYVASFGANTFSACSSDSFSIQRILCLSQKEKKDLIERFHEWARTWDDEGEASHSASRRFNERCNELVMASTERLSLFSSGNVLVLLDDVLTLSASVFILMLRMLKHLVKPGHLVNVLAFGDASKVRRLLCFFSKTQNMHCAYS